MRNMNNDDDLYTDLPEETTSDYIAKIENKLEYLLKEYNESQTRIKELNTEKHNQQKRIKELEKKVENLERNISSLYKTAVTEIKRKDNMLNELRAENDDLAFRRRENYRSRPTNHNRGKLRDHNSSRERHRREGIPAERDKLWDHRSSREKHRREGSPAERDKLRDHRSSREIHRREDSPVEEKHKPSPAEEKHKPRNPTNMEGVIRCKRLTDQNKTSNAFDRLEALFSEDNRPKRNGHVSGDNRPKINVHVSQDNRSKINVHVSDDNRPKRNDHVSEDNRTMPCEAALFSMKKRPWKLITPIKATPDLLKEKYSQLENNKINAIPMINEQRMLSPYKNVGIVEIISRTADELKPPKPAESETITACSVTVSDDIEHGMFARKRRKRPTIQKIIIAVNEVPTC